jgi:hypothetical protein
MLLLFGLLLTYAALAADSVVSYSIAPSIPQGLMPTTILHGQRHNQSRVLSMHVMKLLPENCPVSIIETGRSLEGQL